MKLSLSRSKTHYHTGGCGKGVTALGGVKIVCSVQQNLLGTHVTPAKKLLHVV
jgi:hypothetical protein